MLLIIQFLVYELQYTLEMIFRGYFDCISKKIIDFFPNKVSEIVSDKINHSAALALITRTLRHMKNLHLKVCSQKIRSVTIQNSCVPCGCHSAGPGQASAAPLRGGILPPPAGGPGNESFRC